jgi:glycogen debranching enzyme
MRASFNEEFWDRGTSSFALALDGARRPVLGVTTNPAHCLWSGLIEHARAAALVERLMAEDVYSGWGMRTLSSDNPRFNPIGYHVGTVWPHDNSVAAMGFKMYGFEDALNRVLSGLFDASIAFPYVRLPELFGGDRRSLHGPPVPYPVACRPQSWAAGAFPLLTQAVLGLKPDALGGRLCIVHPVLPPWVDRVGVRNLRVAGGSVSLSYRRESARTRIEVEAANGVDVVLAETWLP